MSELSINHTNVFTRALDAYNNKFRFQIHQGGSRSSKTYSILQMLIYLCLTEKLTISIVRKSFPSLRGSAMRDCISILQELKLYTEKNHHKTEHLYRFNNGSVIEFFAADSEQKLRGRKRDIAYCNEANELSFEEFNQLNMRTTRCLIMDFNPSDNEHWLYKLVEEPKSILIKSSYKDNVFLESDLIDEIENLIKTDENYYKIYCLGERPVATTRIFTHFKQYIELPKDAIIDDVCYGIDFGYNHPISLVKVHYCREDVYIEELLYESKLTSNDLVYRMRSLVQDNKPIYADYARPEIIEDLRRNGFNIKEAKKEVKPGIDTVKTTNVFIHHESVNILKEFRLYSWKSKGDIVLDEPIKMNDDAMDAIRYALHTHKKGKFNSKAAAFYTTKLKKSEDW